MGRHPLSPDVHLLRGNPSHKRLTGNGPQPTIPAEVPEPPSFLSPSARAEWSRVAPVLHARGLLTVLDINLLAAYCAAYSHWRAAEEALAATDEDDQATRRVLTRLARTSCNNMMRVAGEFGMTPAARSRVPALPLGPSKFDGLLA